MRGTIKVEETSFKFFTLHSIMNKLWSIFLNLWFHPVNKLIKGKRNLKSRIFTFVVNIQSKVTDVRKEEGNQEYERQAELSPEATVHRPFTSFSQFFATPYRLDRTSHGDGILLYIRKDIAYIVKSLYPKVEKFRKNECAQKC